MRGLPGSRLLFAGALLLAGVGAVLVSFAERRSGPPEPVALGDPVAINRSALDRRIIDANNSPAVASDPTDPSRLALASRIDASPFGCSLHLSSDSGAGWRRVRIPFAPKASKECFAPDVVFDAAGTLYLSYVTLGGPGNVPEAAWLTRSRDGGRTFSEPRRLLGPLSFQVRLAADPRTPGRIYVSWLDAEEVALFQFPQAGYPIRIMRSEDGGRSFADPARVSPRDRRRVVAGSPAVGPDGSVYVLYVDLLEDRLDYGGRHEGEGGPPYRGRWQLILARSRDGRRFEDSVVEPELVPTERFIVFIPPFPSLAVDPGDAGRLYAAFQDGRDGDADVRVWRSSDQGRSWSEGVRVNDTEPGDGTAQYRPALGVVDGRLDVLYYDRRGDPRRNAFNEASLQSSLDGGRTFGPRLTLSDRPFDSRIGFGYERKLPDLGSRLALHSGEDRAVAVWADTRGGTRKFPKQDLAQAVVGFRPALASRLSAGAEIATRAVGGLLIAAALALVLAPAIAGRKLR